MKELAEEFEGQFTCLVENTEKYITLKEWNFEENEKLVANWHDSMLFTSEI